MASSPALINRPWQRTLADEICCSGIGLHTGIPIKVTLSPAPAYSGLLFQRPNNGGTEIITGSWRKITAETRATTLGEPGGPSISTVEHLMAALAATGVDNALIEVDGPELPAMDGSAKPFVDAIEAVGTVEQDAPLSAIEILREVVVEERDWRIRLVPYDGFAIDYTIDYQHPAIGRHRVEADAATIDFAHAICPARTFCLAEEVEIIRAAGLGLGGSLDNTLVIGPEGIRNRGGMRFPDEFARHKVLDCLGDLWLAGRPFRARLIAERSGHAATHALLRALFSDPACWREIAYA